LSELTSGGATPVTGRHSQGSPLPGCVYEHTMLFCRCIYGRCCSAEIYTCDTVLLEYIIMCDAAIYKSDAGTGDPWEWRPQTRYTKARKGKCPDRNISALAVEVVIIKL